MEINKNDIGRYEDSSKTASPIKNKAPVINKANNKEDLNEEFKKSDVLTSMENLPDDSSFLKASQLFKILGDLNRCKIIYFLSLKDMCVCHLAEAVSMSQSAVSHQLRILRAYRLVKSRREGQNIRYSLTDDHVFQLIEQCIQHIDENRKLL